MLGCRRPLVATVQPPVVEIGVVLGPRASLLASEPAPAGRVSVAASQDGSGGTHGGHAEPAFPAIAAAIQSA
jgi:hypothetical protein